MTRKAEINKQGVFQGTIVAESGNVRILGEDLTIGANLVSGTNPNTVAISIPQTYVKLSEFTSTSFFGLQVGDTYTYSIKLIAPPTKDIKARIQFYTDSNNRTSITGNWIRKGEIGYSFITSTLTQAQRNYSQMELLIDCNDGTTHSDIGYYSEVKLERGSVQTPWVPNSADAAYSKLDFASANPNIHDPIKAEDFYEI